MSEVFKVLLCKLLHNRLSYVGEHSGLFQWVYIIILVSICLFSSVAQS